MKYPSLKGIFFITALFAFSCVNAQNNTGNFWKVWLPEVANIATSDVPGAAFAITANNNKISTVVGNLTTDNCNSYTIGNDLRGYIYYDNNGTGSSKLLRIIDPGTNSVISTIDYSALTPAIGILHTVNSFYISATNRHYIVLSGIGASSVTPVPAIYIYDVTNVTAPVFEKAISIPDLISFNGTAVTPRVTGLVLKQTTYTSAGIQMYLAIDNLKRSAAAAVAGSIFPGVFAKITDPLAASPAVNVYDAMYNTTDYFGSSSPGSFGPHQLALDATNNILYLTTERNKKILAFNVSGASPVATNIIYTVSTAANGGSTTNNTLGYHGIFVSKDGTKIYTGRSGTMVAGTDRALLFTRQTTPGTYTETAYSAELSTTSDVLVKGVNLTPDEQYLYAVTYQNPARVLLLDKTTLSIIQPIQNSNTGTEAVFGRLDPHSYAFTLHDYGDAPVSYGAASHHLANTNYVQDLLRIGATIDGDTSYMQTANFNGDDLSQTSKAGDEDGLSQAMKDALPGLWYGQTGSYTISNIPVKNTTANAAVLRGWVDFNHNGVFDSNESAETNVAINATTATLTWTIPATVTSGPAIIRLRLSTDASLLTANTAGATAATIPIFDGEAEDHQISKISVTGNIFSDGNGNGILDVGENNTGALTLYAYLIKNGLIVDSAHVRPDGTYSFLNVAQNMSTATITIGTNSVSPGSASTVINNVQNSTYTPAGWMYTGESSGNTGDGSNGILTISAGLTSIIQQNFGLNQEPVSDNKSQIITTPVGGSIPAGTATQAVSGNDAEDGVLSNTNTIKITTLPTNATMFYNGIAVTLNQQITNFNPSLLSYTGIATGSIAVTFQYTFLDAASAQDETPATYTLNWLSALPVTIESFTASKESCNSIRLNWVVSNAVNFKLFEIQRSDNGSSFQTLKSINFSDGIVNYSYTDIPTTANRYYYRLKLIDEDGSFSFSSIVTASADCNSNTIKAYPNPVNSQLTITGTQANSLIRIFSNNGLLIRSQKTKGNQTEIDFSLLQSGIYHVQISSEKGMTLNTFSIRKK